MIVAVHRDTENDPGAGLHTYQRLPPGTEGKLPAIVSGRHHALCGCDSSGSAPRCALCRDAAHITDAVHSVNNHRRFFDSPAVLAVSLAGVREHIVHFGSASL